MIVKTVTKALFGSRNERMLKRLSKVVLKINALEADYEKLSDEALRAKTDEFKKRIQQGATLDSLLVEAFAVVREASKRALGMRHFDVQLIGGMVLHRGDIAEMRTGEGKTLVATLPAYLNALAGFGVHVVTVNDYLAKRDAQWMTPIYTLLGMTVGVNLADLSPEEKRAAYETDVTYGTNNEFGFDYLRDNMALTLDDKVQRKLYYAIIDEVDSILIDEARTPLLISGPCDGTSDDYQSVNKIIPKLKEREGEEGPGDYYLDEKQKQAFLTEEGHEHVEQLMTEEKIIKTGESLYDPANIRFMHYLNALLRAHFLFARDVDYIVNAAREIVIVDEHTGRTMPGRRWSDGLHQAVEAKEHVPVQNENQTLASITFQNYFRIYDKLSGMTGTADTEAFEFQQIYHLEVIVIPTNKPIKRTDYPDKIFLNQQGKFKAVIAEIIDCQERGQPVLVGTASIEASEVLSELLKKKKIKHSVLNAKYHEKEATIIAQAGQPSMVTIATNMAGRGTDIVLGGNLDAEIAALKDPTEADLSALKADWQKRHDTVIAAGGLHILGSERHESRRIDNQLRGRSARQGDPGSTRFHLSLEDNLLRIFASPRMGSMMRKLGMKEDESIEHGWITKAIESAQRKVETYHFDVRKQLLEYDNVANDQRKVIYEQRDELLEAEHISEMIEVVRQDVVTGVIDQYIPPESLEEQWNIPGLQEIVATDFGIKLDLVKSLEDDHALAEDGLRELIHQAFKENHQSKLAAIGEESMRGFEKAVMLQTIDTHWKDHLSSMDHLRQGIHLRGYAQKDPKREYKREAFNLFGHMLDGVKYEVLQIISNAQVDAQDTAELEARRRAAMQQQQFNYSFNDVDSLLEQGAAGEFEQTPDNDAEQKPMPFRRGTPKVGRNDLCPCGSGKKYKQCHGKLD
jgi:preprotein translocase subunit SecA